MEEQSPNIYRSKLRLGLCCINTVLRAQKPPVFCSRSCIRKTFTIENAKQKATENVKDISKMIKWNEKNNIKCLRLSSDMFPHFTDTETEKYTIDFAKDELKRAGDLAKSLGHRIVMHPGQYNQVGAIKTNVFEKTCEELSHHANILDAMGIDNNGVLIVHGGGTYGDKKASKRRWIEQFSDLPKNVQDRLVIENCERQYSTRDCLKIAKKCKIPVVFDFHHYHCYSKIYPESPQKSILDLAPKIIKSWKRSGDRHILMHVSEQGCGKIGHHSDYIENLPSELLEIIKIYDVNIDLEIEAKMKEQAIFKLYNKYPEIFL